MKAAIALSLLGCVFGFSGKALAGGSWGPCTPVDGTTYHYNVDVDVGVPDASKNVAGTVLTDVLNWSNGQNVSIICECPDKGDYKIEKDTLIQGVSGIANMTRDNLYGATHCCDASLPHLISTRPSSGIPLI